VGIIRRYRLPSLFLTVALVSLAFVSFFFVFLLAPLVPLGLFYLGYLLTRERRALREERQQARLLAHEAEARRAELGREVQLPLVRTEP
jgi:hypothetical protein